MIYAYVLGRHAGTIRMGTRRAVPPPEGRRKSRARPRARPNVVEREADTQTEAGAAYWRQWFREREGGR